MPTVDILAGDTHPDRSAFLFPGEGLRAAVDRQRVLGAAPDLLAVAAETLDGDPFERELESPRFAQPAIVLASLARWRETRTPAVAFAGHSLGELSALAASGAITNEQAVRLAVARGVAMERAIECGPPGSMLGLLDCTLAEAMGIARECDLVMVTENSPSQSVLSGPAARVEVACLVARGAGMQAIELDVPGAFHSPTMAPACREFAEALDRLTFSAPSAPVISGMTGRPMRDPALELAAGMVAPVRWREVLNAISALGATRFVDVGPGPVLARAAADDPGCSTGRDALAA